MVSSSVGAMNLLSNQTVSTRREISVESTSNDFAKMMDESISKSKDAGIKDDVKAESKAEDNSKVEESELDNKVDETAEDEKTVEDVSSVDEIPEDEAVSEEVSEEILGAVASILNISVEELKAVLEELGMEGKDLLDMENVTKLVMDLKNIDSKLDLLVHEDANDTIKDIQKSIEELVNSLNTENEEGGGMTEQIINSQNVEMNSDANANKGTEFSDNNESDKDLSKGEKTDATLNTSLNEAVDNILNEIEMALEERVDETVATRIVRQIADNISLAIRDKMTSLEMQLNPESLGKVTILLATEEGGITAKITAETEMAKNAIEQQLTILKENFEKQGLKVADIEVTIASHGFEQNLDKNDSKNEEQQKKSNVIRKGLLDEINGISTEEEPKDDIMMQTLGNTVSYLA